MTGDTALVWFRSDRRLHDNPVLSRAVDAASAVVPVYVFDPRAFGTTEFGFPKTGPRRAQFCRESVQDLRDSLRDRGGELVVREGRPEDVLPDLAAAHDADTVHCQTLPAPDEQGVEDALATALRDAGRALRTRWTHTLVHPADLPTPIPNIEDTFTPWREAVEATIEPRDPIPAPDSVRTPPVEAGSVPSLAELGYDTEPTTDDRAAYRFAGGESAGLARIEEYVWKRDRLREYKETRNGLLGPDYSSKFSPWLAGGGLSPRRIYAEVTRYEHERVENDSTYWLGFELLWRDFFQFQFAKHGAAFFQQGGIRDRDIDWRTDETAFRRWADGRTGVPFVDANMRELNATGYLSNRGRQNVASFLANDLGLDWRRGASYFESRLIDYDAPNNWGNWAYVAGTGNDSRDRSFDVLWQAQRYDPDAEFVTHWLPELDGLPAAYAHEPWTMDDTARQDHGIELGVDYPRPMVELDGEKERDADS
ncbi:DASH family cryptochrome [Halorientalis salina]|uniref:DASH family cryptochrome n=1 Tax=Halorientalis salina TaxID=2932266 RepID=UPI0010ABE368|nr:DASH family cryptochrome [Halorientalis salina]